MPETHTPAGIWPIVSQVIKTLDHDFRPPQVSIQSGKMGMAILTMTK